MARNILIPMLFFFQLAAFGQTKPLWERKEFSIYPDRVVQGKYTATALSSKEIRSDYQSPANQFQSPSITFKFSINGKDNEMKPGIDHQFTCAGKNGQYETGLIRFGTQYKDDQPIPANTYMAPNTRLLIRLDMRHVLESFKNNGHYTTWDGTKIYAADFKGVYLAGATEPMMWDFDNLFQREPLNMKDPDGDGIYETIVILNEQKKEKELATTWTLEKDISAFPSYQSEYTLSDAIYNLSLEEMQRAIEPDSTFRTGKEWAGVWTRDISYSIILSMAYLQPKVAMYSLMRKVKNGKIVQDTGTGGAYPISTDRMIWATAAWEIYLATGDKDWLQQAYMIISQSIEDDRKNALDKKTGLIRGESSFLDWREQTYPKWMQPADIFESLCLGTNAVHYQASVVAGRMASILEKKNEAALYRSYAEAIKSAINQWLWLPEKGYYAQYMYGREFNMASPRSEALGEALCVLFGIADEKKRSLIISNTPVTSFGISCIYPQIANIPPYHNQAVWPFVQAYWALAAARAGNDASVMHSIASIYRPAALFLTNKENFVVENGDYKGTQVNSSVMLWSLAGNISLVHKILFGIGFEEGGLHVNPFVPEQLAGKRHLKNLRYRNAIINMYVEGFGNKIASCSINGKKVNRVFIAANSTGIFNISIQLNGKATQASIHEVANHVTVPTPMAVLKEGTLNWEPVDGAIQYDVYKNGKKISSSSKNQFMPTNNDMAMYQVIAIDHHGYQSFASEPVYTSSGNSIFIEAETLASPSNMPYKGFSGEGFIETSIHKNNRLPFTVTIPEPGTYVIDFRYSNGQGPVNTENKCGIRTLLLNNNQIDVVVFPQRGNEEWSNWGFSNPVMIDLQKGKHSFLLSYETHNENMHGEINAAMIDFVRIRKF